MDGINADFAGAKICPAADTCQSSNRTLLKIGKLFTAKSKAPTVGALIHAIHGARKGFASMELA